MLGVSKTGSVSSQGSYWSAGRLTSGTSRVAGVDIAIGMKGGEGEEGTGYARRASSDEESVSLLTADGRKSDTSYGTLQQSDVFMR